MTGQPSDSAPGPTAGRARARHSSATVAEARRLHEAGWTYYAITRLLRRRGTSVDENTVASWVDPDRATRERRRQAERARILAARRTGGRLGAGPRRGPEFRQARIQSLAERGLSHSAIAAVMTFDFPHEPITDDQVRRALSTGQPPTPYRGLVA